MFSPDSRYASAGTTSARGPGGTSVIATRLPVRTRPAALGWRTHRDTERLDFVASIALANPTAFWRLCDASGAIAPDALAARPVIALPGQDT